MEYNLVNKEYSTPSYQRGNYYRLLRINELPEDVNPENVFFNSVEACCHIIIDEGLPSFLNERALKELALGEAMAFRTNNVYLYELVEQAFNKLVG